METTAVYDSYWKFAAERQAMFERRLVDAAGPWTDDGILKAYRFTNAYRVLDRVSQYLVRDVQYSPGRSQAPDEVFFRTILFKIFNKIETWELIEQKLGSVSWQSFDFDAASGVLERARSSGCRIYSAAYIMPAPSFGRERKHDNHLALLRQMMEDGLPRKVTRADSLREVFELMLSYPGLGRFLAFQYAIDLNYSTLTTFSEADFVVAGPGALDGISKCFSGLVANQEDVIFEMVEVQDREFAKRGLKFGGLFGRKLQPIDCQNLFCEISKYARVAHPEVRGTSNRVRIKQSFRRADKPLPPLAFPPRWGLIVPEFQRREPPGQPDLFRLAG